MQSIISSDKFWFDPVVLLLGFFLLAGLGELSTVLADVGEPEDVRDLIYQLDEAESRKEQEKIAQRIRLLGKAALPTLADPPSDISQQTRSWITRIRNGIEKESARIEPTRVTLQGKYSLPDALAELSKQSKHNVQFGTIGINIDATNKKNFSLTNEFYWKAFDQVLDQFQLKTSRLDSSDVIWLGFRPKDRPSRSETATYLGIVRAQPIAMNSYRDFGKRKGTGVDRLQVQFAWEPGLHPFQVELDLKKVEATAAGGQLLLADQNRIRFNVSQSDRQANIEFPFREIQRKIGVIESLTGNLNLKIPGGISRFQFDDIAEASGKKIRKARSQLTIEHVQVRNAQVSMQVGYLVLEAGDSFASHNGWMFRNQVYLVKEKGKQIKPVKILTTRQNKNEMGFEFTFDLPDGPKGFGFVYEAPTAIQSVDIPFQLKNIELR